jgi:hypothetical protein
MPYSVMGYKERAEECVKLANLADDELVRRELLNLRQTYLNIAERLKRQGFVPQGASSRAQVMRDDR